MEEEIVFSEDDGDNDSTVAWNNGLSDDDIDYNNNSTYEIAVNPVQNALDLSNANEPWTHVSEEELGVFNFQFDDSICGTKHISGCEAPREFFNLLFSPRLWDMIVTKTNKYAVASNIKDWKPVTTKSMHGFIAMVFNMGLVRKNQLHDYWSKRNSMSTPWFRMMMPREQFKKILQSFHVVDNATTPPTEDPAYRPSQRVRPLLDYFNVICMHHLYPYQSVAIDESLVAGKTRNPVCQYLPNIHARWGTKVWLLADSSAAHVLKCYIYEGTKYDPTSGIAGTGYVVCLMEMAGLYDRGHHLFTRKNHKANLSSC